jgi:hypothetical protein
MSDENDAQQSLAKKESKAKRRTGSVETKKFVVLALVELADDDPSAERLWVQWGIYSANDQDAARRLALASDETLLGRILVAVPARSWRPQRGTPRVRTTMVFEDVPLS